MSYTAQELNTRVELQRFTTTTNDFGEEIKAWTTYEQAFAKAEPLVGREYVASGAEAGEVNLKVTMMRSRSSTPRTSSTGGVSCCCTGNGSNSTRGVRRLGAARVCSYPTAGGLAGSAAFMEYPGSRSGRSPRVAGSGWLIFAFVIRSGPRHAVR